MDSQTHTTHRDIHTIHTEIQTHIQRHRYAHINTMHTCKDTHKYIPYTHIHTHKDIHTNTYHIHTHTHKPWNNSMSLSVNLIFLYILI